MASRPILVLRTRTTYLVRKTVQTILYILTCGHMGSQPGSESRRITDRFGNTYSFDPKTTNDQVSDRYYIKRTNTKTYHISKPVCPPYTEC